MAIRVTCACGRSLKASEEFAGVEAECPYCGRTLKVPVPAGSSLHSLAEEKRSALSDTGAKPDPDATTYMSDSETPKPAAAERPAAAAHGATAVEDFDYAAEITDFLEPPQSRPKKPPKPTRDVPDMSLKAMAQALLDPRSIHWMLMFGGGLCVLGLIIYLTSLGIFKDALVLACCLIGGTLAVMAGGWALGLKTKRRVAGEALTFLACVVAPLNLWFLSAQKLVLLENHLWVGGVICSLLYVATLFVFKVPLFMYAVEAGVTLTVALFLYSLGLTVDSAHICIALVALGLISIHAERAFAPENPGTVFDRKRFGLPVFWSGQVQLGIGLIVLLFTQLYLPYAKLAAPGFQWPGNLLTKHWMVPTLLWLAGAYSYLYSDLVVRRLGVYLYGTAFCLLAAGVTAGVNLDIEVLIILLAVVAFIANLTPRLVGSEKAVLVRSTAPLGLLLSVVPLLMGIGLHIRATNAVMADMQFAYATTWLFVVAMVVTAISNRASAYLARDSRPLASAYILFCAASLIVGAAGLLRMNGLLLWPEQAPLLMIIPIVYLAAAWLWRGQSPEEPVGIAAHAGTVVILLGVLLGALENVVKSLIPPDRAHLLAAAVFAEATLFYALAALVRRRSVNVYFAAAAACLALWQGFEYLHIASAYFTMLYAVAGVGLLILAKSLGLEEKLVYDRRGDGVPSLRGKGLEVFQCASGVLTIALFAAFFQGLVRLLTKADQAIDWAHTASLVLTAVAGGIGAVLSPPAAWRRAHAAGAVAVGAVAFLTLVLHISLSPWQKLEVFLLVVGGVMLVTAYIGRFREQKEDDLVSMGLWFGSLLTSVPLLVAVVAHRTLGTGLSLPDELGLITVCAALLLTGVGWQVKGSTVFGGSTFVLYVLILLISLGWHAQLAVGAYLAIGGGTIFLVGLILSVCRERLVALPEQMAKREGMFKVLNWR